MLNDDISCVVKYNKIATIKIATVPLDNLAAQVST